jgi:anti-sigma regulatory factor (Ser/Thr protein kinase)
VPYVTCPRCGVRSYAPIGVASSEPCPNCGSQLEVGASVRPQDRGAPVVSCRLDPTAVAPTHARRALDHLEPTLGDEALDQLQLLVTELISNSVRHGELTDDSEIAVDVFLFDSTIYAEVRDDGVGFTPHTPDPNPLRSSGWGLWLLDTLAHRWGIDGAAGTTAWFEMRYRPPS